MKITMKLLANTVLVSGLYVVLTGGAYAAKSWGVSNEVKAEFTGTVVDIACELSGDCPPNCGDGNRQLGLKTEQDGTLLVAKNLTLYTGASVELVAFCGQTIEVDGLFTEHRNVRFFQVQQLRVPGGDWQKATRFHQVWAEQYGGKPSKAKNWYKKDPRVETIITRDGYLGLGTAKDQEFFK